MKTTLRFSGMNIELKQHKRFEDACQGMEGLDRNFEPNTCTVSIFPQCDAFKPMALGDVRINGCSIGHSNTIARLIRRMSRGANVPIEEMVSELVSGLQTDLNPMSANPHKIFQGKTPTEFFNDGKSFILDTIRYQYPEVLEKPGPQMVFKTLPPED